MRVLITGARGFVAAVALDVLEPTSIEAAIFAARRSQVLRLAGVASRRKPPSTSPGAPTSGNVAARPRRDLDWEARASLATTCRATLESWRRRGTTAY
jgi:nucleoside-diphosphate-sugar epimerase